MSKKSKAKKLCIPHPIKPVYHLTVDVVDGTGPSNKDLKKIAKKFRKVLPGAHIIATHSAVRVAAVL